MAPSPTSAPARLAFALAEQLHSAGAPVWRVEGGVERLGAALHAPMACMATPTGVFVQVGDHLEVLRVRPAGVDLARQSEVEAALFALEVGMLDLPGFARALDAAARPRAQKPMRDLLAGMAVAVGGAALFGGGWGELLGAGVAGLGVGALDLAALRSPPVARLLPLLAGLLAGALPRALAPMLPMNEQIVTLASLIVVLPGLTFTVALAELATGHLSAGTARAAGAIVALLQLALGVGFAAGLTPALSPPQSSGLLLPWGSTALALLITGLGLALLFRARKADAPIIIGAVTTSWASISLLAPAVGTAGGAFLTAALLSLAGDLLHLATRRSPQLITVPGVLLLVPGSVGFSALRELLADQTISGMGAIFDMFVLAASIVGGLLAAASLSALGGSQSPGMMAR